MAESEDVTLDYNWGGDGSNLDEPVRAHVEAALVPTDIPYPLPVDQLLRLGDPGPREMTAARVVDLGLTQEHVPDLIRMVRDRAPNTARSDSDEVWAPIHALEALKYFNVSSLVAELIPLFDVDSDWFSDTLPDVLGNAGEAALAPLQHYLQDRARWVYGRAAAGNAIVKVGQQHPESRERAVQILTDELDHASENDEGLNGFLISDLLHLKAVEALPVIRRAFEQELVDESILDWEWVLSELKQPVDPSDPLIRRSRAWRETMRSSMWPFARREPSSPSDWQPAPSSKQSGQSKQKHKRKMAEASRKANRKKKRK